MTIFRSDEAWLALSLQFKATHRNSSSKLPQFLPFSLFTQHSLHLFCTRTLFSRPLFLRLFYFFFHLLTSFYACLHIGAELVVPFLKILARFFLNFAVLMIQKIFPCFLGGIDTRFPVRLGGYPKDVTADSFMVWRGAQTLAAKTLNDYLDAANALLKWMQRATRLENNPLQTVGKVKTAGREKVQRRALTDEEVRRLLAVAGPRRPVYLTAINTGLRRAELKSLQKGDCHLYGDNPCLKVRASTTKNEKAVRILGLVNCKRHWLSLAAITK